MLRKVFLFGIVLAGALGLSSRVHADVWRDPTEGAFSIEVPSDWKVSGGIFRQTPSLPHPMLDIVSPDGGVTIFFNQGLMPFFFQLPNPLSFQTGLRQTFGIPFAVLQTPSQILKRYIAGNMRSYCSSTRLLGMAPLTNPASAVVPVKHLYEADPRQMHNIGGVPGRFFMAQATFQCGKARGYALAVVGVIEANNNGTWWVDSLYGYIAPEGRAAEAASTTKAIADSYREDPQWTAQQKKIASSVVDASRQAGDAAMTRSRILSKSNDEIMQMQRDSFEAQSRSQDENTRKFSNTILDKTDLRDPETGEQTKVDDTSNYYWRDGDKVIGTDLDKKPTIDAQPLENLQ